MARKSNKTSHVLHLLAGEEPVPETSEKKEGLTEAETAEDKTIGSKGSSAQPGSEEDMPNISIISTGNSENDPVADLIKGQLEEDFPEDILNPQPGPDDPNIPDSVGAFEDNNLSDPAGAPAPSAQDHREISDMPADSDIGPLTEETTATEQPSAEQQTIEEAPEKVLDHDEIPLPDTSNTSNAADPLTETEIPVFARSDDSTINDTETDEDPIAETSSDKPPLSQEHLDSVLYPIDGEPLQNYRFVNVMEYIVKDLVIDYMKRFDMCTCERCVVDTIALTLTYCNAKYIVVDSHTVSPLLNFYSNRYLGDVTVELTKACIKIKDNPRH